MAEQSMALVLPDEQTFAKELEAINRFQKICHAKMIEGHDYGIIPGTQKPTLLKPGAEKIAKLLGLADTYELLDRQEDWQRPFFRYLIRCTLTHIGAGVAISEGLGECNSMEGKYRYRWLWSSELPEGFDKAKGITRWVKVKGSDKKVPQYRVENDDLYSIVNTILKMAKKRALVDAALSAGRLSDVFTQDIEDIHLDMEEPSAPEGKVDKVPIPKPESGKTQSMGPPLEGKEAWRELLRICPEHGAEWQVKKGQYGEWRSHIKPDGKTYCNLKAILKDMKAEIQKQLGWEDGQVNDWIKERYQEKTWSKLTEEEQAEAVHKIDLVLALQKAAKEKAGGSE